MTIFSYTYTRKDLILYALSIGMGSDDTAEDLRFLYEYHASFSIVPLFCLTFTFWSTAAGSNNACMNNQFLPNFPPPLMAQENVIPVRFLKDQKIDMSGLPIIHTWQSITWERTLPIPSSNESSRILADMETIRVEPKSVGTFVTSQSKIWSSIDHSLLCTLQSTALVMGIPKDDVLSFNSENGKRTTHPIIPQSRKSDFEFVHATSPNQALLYRVASGDSNHIHVDTSAAEMMGSERDSPLLHGLFSFAIVIRAILKFKPDADKNLLSIEARFSRPVFVGDILLVRLWRDRLTKNDHFLFCVHNQKTGSIVIDNGSALLRTEDNSKLNGAMSARSRL